MKQTSKELIKKITTEENMKNSEYSYIESNIDEKTIKAIILFDVNKGKINLEEKINIFIEYIFEQYNFKNETLKNEEIIELITKEIQKFKK